MQYCQVIVDGVPFIREDGFTYKIPDAIKEHIEIGSLVYVPFGKNEKVKKGYVIRLSDTCSEDSGKIKNVLLPHTYGAVLDEKDVALCQYLSDYYACALIYALNLVIPKYLLKHTTVAVKDNEEAIHRVNEKNARELSVMLEQGRGNILHHTPKETSSKKYYQKSCEDTSTLEIWVDELKKAPKQKAIFELFLNKTICTEDEIKEHYSNPQAQLKALLEKGYIKVAKSINNEALPEAATSHLIMNEVQNQIYHSIAEDLQKCQYAKHLLNGVTGSGKTLIYENLIEQTLLQKKQALILVPEIALSNQLFLRLNKRFAGSIGLLHSQLTDKERFAIWQQVKTNDLRIIIGPRSALFMPFNALGLIIIDEEHDSSYKQSEPDPRYHAINVATFLAQREQAVVVLGSATPSVDTLYEVIQGRCSIHNMTERANQSELPSVHLVDMIEDREMGNRNSLSEELKAAMRCTLERSEQVIILINKKGYASSIICNECGEVIKCPKCDIPLTYYQSSNILKCNYCEFQMPMIKTCPSCGNDFLKKNGLGTETVEEECKRLFPNAMVARLDAQSLENKATRDRIFSDYAHGDIDILIGTQLLAKGFDFNNTTCIGVVHADITLNLPDFRGAERCFQLMVQVAGRAGRDNKESHVFIQTYQKEHYAYTNAIRQNMHQFFLDEMSFRKEWLYPPIVRLCRIIVSDYQIKNVESAMQSIYNYIVGLPVQMQLIGPAFAPLPKKNNRFRMHLIIKAKSVADIHTITSSFRKNMHTLHVGATTRIVVDVDPENIF